MLYIWRTKFWNKLLSMGGFLNLVGKKYRRLGWECLQNDRSVIKCTKHIVHVWWATLIRFLSMLEKIVFQQYITSLITIFKTPLFYGERSRKQSKRSYSWSSCFYWNKMGVRVSHRLHPMWNFSIASIIDKEIHQTEIRSGFDTA